MFSSPFYLNSCSKWQKNILFFLSRMSSAQFLLEIGIINLVSSNKKGYGDVWPIYFLNPENFSLYQWLTFMVFMVFAVVNIFINKFSSICLAQINQIYLFN